MGGVIRHSMGLMALVLALGLAAPSADAATKKRSSPTTSASKSSKAAKATKTVKATKASRSTKAKAKATSRARSASSSRALRARAQPVVVRQSFGQMAGLHDTADPLALKSSVALVIDQDTNEVLFTKNEHAVLPIASITKLMTAVVVTEAKLPLDDMLTITQDDVDTEKGTSSRLGVGTTLSRGDMLHLALMSSENRAANALGRHYPGGLPAFVNAMNAKAQLLGMHDTRYVEPTGLSNRNQSSARDLATLVGAASAHPIIRELSTSPAAQVDVGKRQLAYRTTNRLVLNPEWDIGLQKTGYISEAGQCLVMQAQLAGRKLIMVLLDSAGKYSRIGDAERLREWLQSPHDPVAIAHSGRPLAVSAMKGPR